MFKILKKMFDNEYKELYRFSKLADQIDALDEEMSKLSDKKLAKSVFSAFFINCKSFIIFFQSSINKIF